MASKKRTGVTTEDHAEYWIPGGGGIHNPPSDLLDNEDKWMIHWRTLQRWHQRILKIESQREEDLVDFVHAFIVSCFHMRDWLVATGKCSKQELNQFFKANIEFQVCRDIANGLKHLALRDPSISGELGLHREWDHFIGGSGGTMFKITFFKGKDKHDWEVSEFVTECMRKWKAFLAQKGLLGS
mgnify:CR=1 FL=1